MQSSPNADTTQKSKTEKGTMRGAASLRFRRLRRTLRDMRITLFCGFLTFVVLRSSLGAGKFGTPKQDYNELKEHLHLHLPRRYVNASSDAGIANANAATRRSTLSLSKKDELDDEPPPSGPYSLGMKISDWDQQRADWLSRNAQYPNYINGKPRILLVTGSQPTPCENPVGDHYLLKSIKNKIDYCRLHNIAIFYNMAHLDTVMSGFWAKLPLLRKLMLSHPEVEFIWWMDSDAMFTDMVFKLPIERYKDYNAVFHGWEELVYKKSWIGLNTGSFLIRNCQWSLDLLDAWAPMGPKGRIRDEAGRVLTRYLEGRPEFEADDQSAMIYLLVTQREKWGKKVYLESAYYLHGYWMILVDKYEEMMEKHHPGLGDDRWPFVTHFVGCKPCGKGTDYAAQRCLKQMERAFNFADNQVLQMYGFRHKHLGSAKVRRIRNETGRPLDFEDDLKLLHGRSRSHEDTTTTAPMI